MLPKRSLSVEIWLYGIMLTSLILYIIVVYTLLYKRKKEDPKVHLFYLILGETAMLLQEMLITISDVGPLLPYFSFYSEGPFTRLGISIRFQLGLYLLGWHFLSSAICMCLFFRYFVLSGRKVRGHTINEKLIHILYFPSHILAAPSLFLLYKADIPKDFIAKEYPGQVDLLSPNLYMLDVNVGARLVDGLSTFGLSYIIGALACYVVWISFLGWLSLIFIYAIYTLLDGNTTYSKKTKELHKRAVYSAVFLAVPAASNTLAVIITGLGPILLKSFLNVEFGFYPELSSILVSMALSNSLLSSLNTLFHAHRDSLRKNSIKVRKVPDQNQRKKNVKHSGQTG